MAVTFATPTLLRTASGRVVLTGEFTVTVAIVFSFGLLASLRQDGITASSDSRMTVSIGWLPRGTYRFKFSPKSEFSPLEVQGSIQAWHTEAMETRLAGETSVALKPSGAGHEEPSVEWTFESVHPTLPMSAFSWSRDHSDWFYRHFDHAAPTVISYLLGNHPALRGDVLDVGCGDGITDLGIALRTKCRSFVGIDPFRGFERLPEIVTANNLPADIIPPNLRFMAEDANFLPFDDDSFDVIVSWGSVEHMRGGYLQALREMKRVLRPDGLLMAAPGLYYSNIGHHLTEFSSEPFFHLKKSREEIRKLVLETPPRYIDRSGEFSSNEQFWQWFTELNPITVARFEQELRALDFRPWRIALRTDGLVEYTPEIEHYPIQDLANIELYSSWINRKVQRPQ